MCDDAIEGKAVSGGPEVERYMNLAHRILQLLLDHSFMK
jgi:hypothetical protein